MPKYPIMPTYSRLASQQPGVSYLVLGERMSFEKAASIAARTSFDRNDDVVFEQVDASGRVVGYVTIRVTFSGV